MKRYGVPGVFAAAVETAASMGGLLMPPMMGVGAFLMADFLGVPYWDVVVRGFALALTYYVALAFAVYLFTWLAPYSVLPRLFVQSNRLVIAAVFAAAFVAWVAAVLLRRSRVVTTFFSNSATVGAESSPPHPAATPPTSATAVSSVTRSFVDLMGRRAGSG